MAPFDGSAWEEEDEEAVLPPDVPYYNNFPGKQPPPGGLIDMRTRPGATLVREVHINTDEICSYRFYNRSKHRQQCSEEMKNL